MSTRFKRLQAGVWLPSWIQPSLQVKTQHMSARLGSIQKSGALLWTPKKRIPHIGPHKKDPIIGPPQFIETPGPHQGWTFGIPCSN